jgi:drug/metabolite transporter (DMT)-like permease
MARHWKLILAFASVYLIWGSTYLGIRFAIETLPPFLMAGTRFIVAGSLLYGYLRFKKGAPAPTRLQWRNMTVVGALLLLGGNGLVTIAEQHVASGLAALLISGTPIWIAVLSWLFFGGLRPAGRLAVGLLGGLIGVILLIGPTDIIQGKGVDPFGIVLLLMAELCWSFGSLYSRKVDVPKDSLVATGMEMLAGGTLLFIAGTITGEWGKLDLAIVSLNSTVALAYLTIFGSLIAYSAYIWLLQATTPARATTYAYVNPVVALFLGWALADEPLNARTIVAAAIIIASVVMITTYQAEVSEKTAVKVPQPLEASTDK